jgi:hypothetical protein
MAIKSIVEMKAKPGRRDALLSTLPQMSAVDAPGFIAAECQPLHESHRRIPRTADLVTDGVERPGQALQVIEVQRAIAQRWRWVGVHHGCDSTPARAGDPDARPHAAGPDRAGRHGCRRGGLHARLVARRPDAGDRSPVPMTRPRWRSAAAASWRRPTWWCRATGSRSVPAGRPAEPDPLPIPAS